MNNKAVRWILISLVFFIPVDIFMLFGLAFGAEFGGGRILLGFVVAIGFIFGFFFFLFLLRRSRGENFWGVKLTTEKTLSYKWLVFWMIFCLILPMLVSWVGYYIGNWYMFHQHMFDGY